MLKLLTTAIVLGLVAGAAAAQTAPVDEYHHATPPTKAAPAKKGFALKNDVIYQRKPRQTAPVYLLENRGPGSGNGATANETKHNANNW